MGIAEGAKAALGQAAAGGKGIAVGYWRGLTYPFRGVKFVFFQHPGLIRFWIVPILLTMLLLGAVGAGGWYVREPATDAILGATDGAPVLAKEARYYDKSKGRPNKPQLKPPVPRSGWWADAGRTALGWLILLSIWGLGLFAVVMLSNVLAAPFNDLLSEEVEHLATGARGPPFSLKVLLRDTVRTIGLELVKWAIYLAVMLVLLIVSNVVPVVGHVLSSIVGFLFTTLYLAIDYIDWPSSRRNRSIAYRFSVVREHFGAMLGFGSGVWLFLFLPLVNLLFMPAAVAGGTLMFLDLEGRGQGTAEDAP